MYSEIVPRTMPLRRDAGDASRRRSSSRVVPRRCTSTARRRSTPSSTTAGVPLFGICYGAQLLARDLGGDRRQDRARRVRPHRSDRAPRPAPLFREQPTDQVVWMSHFDTITEAPPGARVLASTPRHAGRRVRRPRPSDLRRAVPPRGRAHRARPGGAQGVPLRRRRVPAHVDERLDHRGGRRRDPGPGRHRAGDLRALRRRRLRGRGRARAQGDRRPAHLRVRRHRAAAAWARPSRWRRRSSASSRSTSCT